VAQGEAASMTFSHVAAVYDRHTFFRLVLMVAGILFSQSSIHAEFSGKKVNEEALPYTSKLPEIDKIEVYQLDTTAEGHVERVIRTHTITGKDAQDLAKLWRKQDYDFHYAAACFDPAYAVLFWHGDSLVVEGQICFNCAQILFTKKVTKLDITDACAYQGFNVRTEQAHALKKQLDALFSK
jgi:hypothetical protein